MYIKRILLCSLLLLLLFVSWWAYRLVWGKPLNIDHFYERVFIEYLLDDPEQLTRLGMIDNTLLDFHSDDLTDASPSRALKLVKNARRNLETLRSYEPDGQTDAQRLSTDVLEWVLDDGVRGEEFVHHHYPVNPLSGVQSQWPGFMDAFHQVVDEQSAENYISRLSKIGIKFSQVIEGLRIQEEKGIIPPKFVMQKVLAEMQNFIAQPTEENILFASFKRKLQNVENLSDKRKEALYDQVRSEIHTSVHPAYKVLIRYFEVLQAKATSDHGVWKLPNGIDYYAYKLRSHTTTDLTPEEVHQLGLREVTRIQGEMRAILDSLGYRGKTVAEDLRDLSTEARFRYPDTDSSRAKILADYQSIIDEINQNLSHVFDLRPVAGIEVKRLPEFKEKTSPSAYYNPPSLDGSRPGVFYVNLRNVKDISKLGMRTLAYHEAVPGHHFQIALQQQIEGVPTFRKVIPFTAYVEGWALYAEHLAWEYGFHKDAYSNLGRLQAELLRAVRLVVDTGIHHKRWTREQAIEYMLATIGGSRSEIVAEVERYIVEPAQACAYKIGMIKILELRKKARQALGDRFDIREFHNAVLQNGAMPLSILERVVNDYIEKSS